MKWSVACTLLLLPFVGATPAYAASPSPGEPPASESASPHGSVYVDPAGFLLFGPTLGVELGGRQGHLSGTVYGRWFNAGLLSHQLFLNGDRGDTFDFSYGAGLSGRYYFQGHLAGPHLGVDVEYLSTRIEDHADFIATNSQYIVPAVEGGYRLPIERLFYVGVSAALGYAIRLGSSVDNLPGGMQAGTFAVSNESQFYGSASVDLGVYF